MRILPGRSYPIGATVLPDGVNFCLFSRNATGVELLLFDHVDAARPERTLPLDPKRNRTFYYWHVFVEGLRAGQLYGYRVHGPNQPTRGLRFDGSKVLIDPYSLAVFYGDNYDRRAAMRPGDNCAQALKSVVADPSRYDWEGDRPLQRPLAEAVIYELHVGGFTRHPSSGLPAALRGTYAGLVEKIPYLQALGINTVELLPVQQFDEQEAPACLDNYWGYNPLAFFAPHRGYCACRDALGPLDEFRDMVKALHRAGIEVILDVVFNHTAEGNQNGPTLSFRGIENRAYYMLSHSNPAVYHNYSGCGNTLNANQSIVRRLIMDCLRYWVRVMHVDGFRFDLASVMARDESGQPLRNPPILWEIESDPVLAGAEIIAEAWDAGGLYQVGSFIGHRWAEWNGYYRDDVRRFVKGDTHTVGRLAARIAGSRDIYPQEGREPNRSINFITCHDGFTLNDLVSYNAKHNDANGEANRDGHNDNASWNCGIEGETEDTSIQALRLRQIKNFLVILFTSQGTPMLLMGDEVRRSQQGNNNAYCQNNPLSWFDWDDIARHDGLLRFTRCLLHFYHTHSIFHAERFWSDIHEPEVIWHGTRLDQPDWSPESHSLAYELVYGLQQERLFVVLNAYWQPLHFELPSLPPGRHWMRLVDTALPSPDDFCVPGVPLAPGESACLVQPRAAVILKQV
ncbi:MAG: glycogen debranching protein GlgX [Chloroflexota bacterium]